MPTNPRILVVDDEPNVRLVFRTTLETSGYVVDEAPDGQQAVARLHREPYSLVLLDLRMPVLDGMATLRLMREQSLSTPVVIVTAHGSVPDAVEAMKLGAIDFIQKPVRPEELRRVAADVIARNAKDAAAAQSPLSAAKREINRRDFEEAQRLLARGDDMDLAETHYLRGLLAENRGDRARALSAYRQALDADPSYAPALARLDATSNPK